MLIEFSIEIEHFKEKDKKEKKLGGACCSLLHTEHLKICLTSYFYLFKLTAAAFTASWSTGTVS